MANNGGRHLLRVQNYEHSCHNIAANNVKRRKEMIEFLRDGTSLFTSGSTPDEAKAEYLFAKIKTAHGTAEFLKIGLGERGYPYDPDLNDDLKKFWVEELVSLAKGLAITKAEIEAEVLGGEKMEANALLNSTWGVE